MVDQTDMEIKSSNSDNQMEIELASAINTMNKTFQQSSYVGRTLLAPYNPDDIWQKNGDYSIYEDMLLDDQVSLLSQIKKDLILGSGWKIATQSDDHNEIQKFLQTALIDSPDNDLDESIDEILSGDDFGFSITEKTFKKNNKNQIVLRDLKTREPNSFTIHTDEMGNITKYEQVGTSQTISVNPKAIIHYISRSKFGNPYGHSDLRPAHGAWFAKKNFMRFYAIFIEKAASPIPIAKYDIGVPKATIESIFNVIKKFQTKTSMVIPKQFEIDFLESKGNGEAYIKAIHMFNMFIGRSMFMPDLLGMQGKESSGGSQALGREQMMMMFKHIGRRKQKIEKIINKHLIQPLTVWNFGFVENGPKWVLNDIEEERIFDQIKAWNDVLKTNVYVPTDEEIRHFQKLVNFPESEIIERPKPDISQFPVGDINQ
jgi:phage gp29-like protein